jgi:hypothetical protein
VVRVAAARSVLARRPLFIRVLALDFEPLTQCTCALDCATLRVCVRVAAVENGRKLSVPGALHNGYAAYGTAATEAASIASSSAPAAGTLCKFMHTYQQVSIVLCF